MEIIPESQFNQLRNTLGTLDQALGCINESIVWLDIRGRIEWSNTVFNQLTGRARIQTLGVDINRIISFKQNNIPVLPFDICQKVFTSNHSQIVEYEKNGDNFLLEIFVNTTISQDDNSYFIIAIHNVTEQQHMFNTLIKKDEELMQLSHYLDGVIQTLPNMLIVTTHTLKIKLINQLTLDVLGYKEEELLGNSLDIVFSNSIDSTAEYTGLDGIRQMLNSSITINQESTYTTATQESIPILFSASILRNELNETQQDIICIAQDISQQKKSEKEIAYLATHDMLTSLPNRMAFENNLKKEIAKSHRQGTILAVLFIDLDNFKHINDSLGHHVGDRLLAHVSKLLSASLRQGDTIACISKQDNFLGRLGGDEFAILLTGLNNEFDAGSCAKRILNIFSTPIKDNLLDLHISLSIGIAIASGNNVKYDVLVKNADMAMYRAKEMGRSNFQFYSETLSIAYDRRLKLENGLHQALENDHFYLVYQPQYDLEKEIIYGMEVLLRWKHPELGFIPPDEFIAIAEKSGLIIPIGKWVITQACCQYKQWQSQGLINDLKLSINVSPYQLIKGKFIKELHNILSETNVSPHILDFEITETGVMTDLRYSEQVLNELKNMGIQLSIDDFGTGYSSLARIKELPINTLKIDKSFIQKITTNQDDAAIVKSIIGLAQLLNLSVIAEGAEDKEQVQYLANNGCKLVQGYYFSKPIVAEDFIKLLTEASVSSSNF